MKFLPRGAAALAVAAIFPIVTAAQAPQGPPPQGPPPQGEQGQGRGGMRGMAPRQAAAQRPQLTEQQREQLRTFEEQHRTSLETTHRELGDLHRQLDEALTAAQLDNGKINSLRSSIVQKETALAQARVDRLSKVSSILTAEQRQAFRGRGIGQVFGPGGAGRGGPGGAMRGGQGGMMGGGRGGVMAGRPGGTMMGRGGGGRGVALLTLLVGNAAAVVPARSAARTRPAVVLRSE